MTNNEYIQEVGGPPRLTHPRLIDHVIGHRDPPMRLALGHTIMREPRLPAKKTMHSRN